MFTCRKAHSWQHMHRFFLPPTRAAIRSPHQVMSHGADEVTQSVCTCTLIAATHCSTQLTSHDGRRKYDIILPPKLRFNLKPTAVFAKLLPSFLSHYQQNVNFSLLCIFSLCVLPPQMLFFIFLSLSPCVSAFSFPASPLLSTLRLWRHMRCNLCFRCCLPRRPHHPLPPPPLCF